MPHQHNSTRVKLTPYFFLLPAIALLGLTVFIPAIGAFALSFSRFDYDLTQLPQWVGLDNFSRLKEDELFLKAVWQTILYIFGVVPVLVIAPLGLAILVNQKLKGINWFRTAFYTPVVISMVVAGISWKALYTQNGLLNQFLKQIGFNEGIPWLTSTKLALCSVMVVTIWKGLGYYMVIYLAGLQSISPELYEAAAIDGSDSWRKHLDITLPLMFPYVFLVAVISTISATKVFEEVYIMTRGGPSNSSNTVVHYLYQQISAPNLDMSYGSAIGFVLFLGILSLSIINLKLTAKDN